MSSALTTAIWRRLSGAETLTGDALTAQNALVAALAKDPSYGATRGYVHFGNRSELKGTDGLTPLPCITFRPDGGIPDGRFGTHLGAVSASAYAIEIWASDRGATTITNIAEYVEQLLDRRRQTAGLMTLSSGVLVWSEADSELALIYDGSLHQWAGLRRFVFTEVRY